MSPLFKKKLPNDDLYRASDEELNEEIMRLESELEKIRERKRAIRDERIARQGAPQRSHLDQEISA